MYMKTTCDIVGKVNNLWCKSYFKSLKMVKKDIAINIKIWPCNYSPTNLSGPTWKDTYKMSKDKKTLTPL